MTTVDSAKTLIRESLPADPDLRRPFTHVQRALGLDLKQAVDLFVELERQNFITPCVDGRRQIVEAK